MRHRPHARNAAALALGVLAALGAVVSSQAQPNRPNVPRGRNIFRFDTFGSEQLWTDVLSLHQLITDAVDPTTALGLGLKVDVDALPSDLVTALENGDPAVDLEDPATTIELIRLDAVVGVKGTVENGTLTRVGITCALCHSTVDDSFADGIGHRLDGWPNRDLDVGQILSLVPTGLDAATKAEVAGWGPGRYDARHHAFNGTTLQILHPDSLPILIPPIYGLRGVKWETGTGDGPISYWNRYVGVSQMGGHGDFSDDRIDLDIDQSDPDRVAPKLPALLRYQLSLLAPRPPAGSFNRAAAARGRQIFADACASCHIPRLYTDVNENEDPDQPLLHDADEVSQDQEYADRSATGAYRTTPLRALWQHAPYFHDGSAPDLEAVVEHYEQALPDLDLTNRQKADLIQFLRSL